MLRWFEHHQVYCPSKLMEGSAADLGRPFEEADLVTSDQVRLHGWFFPADRQAPHAAVLFLLFRGGCGGGGDGQSEAGAYWEAAAVWGWLGKKDYAPANIIALGKSLGGGVASELALRETIGGLILQSTYTSIPDLGRELF